MSNFVNVTHLSNILVFPRRGDPPREMPPYVRDPGDPYVFILPLVPCSKRQRGPGGNCGGCKGTAATNLENNWCGVMDEPTDRVRCHLCTLPEKG